MFYTVLRLLHGLVLRLFYVCKTKLRVLFYKIVHTDSRVPFGNIETRVVSQIYGRTDPRNREQ
jgi:hypothetical protein